jgi:surface protein
VVVYFKKNIMKNSRIAWWFAICAVLAFSSCKDDEGPTPNAAPTIGALAFITTWETTSPDEPITIRTNPGFTYDYTVDWGDGMTDENQTGSATHTYATAGTYTVKIIGDFPAIYFNDLGDKNKIQTIEQWGDIQWEYMERAFRGCGNLTYNATDAPDLSAVTNMVAMFSGATSFNGDISGWDVSSVTDMRFMFNEATSFNGDISGWDVSSVNDMRRMFFRATAFSQDLSGWDTSSVTSCAGFSTDSGLTAAQLPTAGSCF